MTKEEEFESYKESHKELLREIYELLKHDQDACLFVANYGNYVEMIDDIIDEPKNPELVLKAFNLGMQIFSSAFWQRYSQQLMLVDTLINNQYADVIQWENADSSDWKKEDARCLSHVGYDMFLAVVCLVAGREALRKISSRFRQYSHLKHRMEKH